MNISQEILDLSKEIQKEKHDFVNSGQSDNKDISTTAATETFWCIKYAEWKKEVDELKALLLPLG